MSKTTAALEAAVAVVVANAAPEGAEQTRRQRVESDRAFAAILKLIAPRIRHFTKQYGLTAHWDDAEQVCAIGVHRAIQAYDPAKAQFTTFVNWQLRGELQGLRFRLMTDQRPSARKVAATTVSLSANASGADGEDAASLETLLVDEDALERTEAGAAGFLAGVTRARLVEQYCDQLRDAGMEQLRRRARQSAAARPGRAVAAGPRLRTEMYPVDAAALRQLEEKIAAHREAIERRLGDEDETGQPMVPVADEAARERSRQVAKRAAAALADMADRTDRFASPIRARVAA